MMFTFKLIVSYNFLNNFYKHFLSILQYYHFTKAGVTPLKHNKSISRWAIRASMGRGRGAIVAVVVAVMMTTVYQALLWGIFLMYSLIYRIFEISLRSICYHYSSLQMRKSWYRKVIELGYEPRPYDTRTYALKWPCTHTTSFSSWRWHAYFIQM